MPSSCGIERYRLFTSIVHRMVLSVMGVDLSIVSSSFVFLR